MVRLWRRAREFTSRVVTYPQLLPAAPPPGGDIVNLAHAPAIGIGDAGICAAAVAIAKEAVAGLDEQAAFFGTAIGGGAAILRGHFAVEGSE